MSKIPGPPAAPDVVVVGAGMGGIYAIIRLRELGLSVVGIEAAPDVGGVWYHNAYPGARVDLESDAYSYFFDPDLYQSWEWQERYAAQPDILAYLRHVAERYDVRRSIHFDTRVVCAQWRPHEDRYVIETDQGQVVQPRFLVMASGQLSRPREPEFPGLRDFRGEWYQTSRWPDSAQLAGKRVGVIGTGSSGVQAITAIAKEAGHLHVFQRTPNYSVPAHNRPMDTARRQRLVGRVDELWDDLLATPSGNFFPPPAGRAADFSVEEQQQLLEQRWAFGGQSMLLVFSDQGTNWETNDLVSEFVRGKVRQVVRDPEVRETLVPDAYPIGVKRLCLDTGYYEVFNQDNVSLVNLRREPIRRITPDGIETSESAIALDVIVFALGFEAFTGALDDANITNDAGMSPSDVWARGPQTYLGLMTAGFPNLFVLTGPGSPSTLTNMIVGNVQHVDFIATLLAHMRKRGRTTVEPRPDAQDWWTRHAAECAEHLIRRKVDNYMVHVNDDGSRVFIPYTGSFAQYVRHCRAETEKGFLGFDFG